MVRCPICQTVQEPFSGGSIAVSAAILWGCDRNFLPAGTSHALLSACARELLGLCSHCLDFLPSPWVQTGQIELRFILQTICFQQLLLPLLWPCILLVLRMIICPLIMMALLLLGCVVPASPPVRPPTSLHSTSQERKQEQRGQQKPPRGWFGGFFVV